VVFGFASVQIAFIASICSRIFACASEDGAVVLDFSWFQAAAMPKRNRPPRHLVDRGDVLGGLDRVALDDEAMRSHLSFLVAQAAASA